MGVVNITPWPLEYAPPKKKIPVTTEYEAAWAPEPVWTFWGKEYLPPHQIRTPDLPTRSLMSILT